MKQFVITIDSSCDGNPKELFKKDVNVIYYNYSDGSTEYLDKMDEKENIHIMNQMREGKRFHTSQLNEYAYYYFFKNELKRNKNIIHISLTEGLSGSINQARKAANKLHEEDPSINIKILDSLIACNGELVILDEAISLLNKGLDIEEAYSQLSIFVKHVNTFYTTDTLSYFVKGGRLSKVSGLLGTLLKINPVLTCTSKGCLKVDKQLRGRKNAQNYIVDKMKETTILPQDQTLYICHADNLEGAEEYKNRLQKEFNFKQVKIYEMGPIIGTHTGPGLIAIFYKGKERTQKWLQISNIYQNIQEMKR